jgi:hypothetical protein
MHPLTGLHKRTFATLQLNVAMLGHILEPLTPQTATTLRDGPEGWTTLEVVCHLRDLDEIFRQRVVLVCEHDHPTFPMADQNKLAIEGAYNQQDLGEAYRTLCAARQALIQQFERLTDEQWERTGLHPTRGHFTMTDVLTHVAWHDANHLEQITRILWGGRSAQKQG